MIDRINPRITSKADTPLLSRGIAYGVIILTLSTLFDKLFSMP